jgi:MFS transporter, DHA1 family, multidrug resistance protein
VNFTSDPNRTSIHAQQVVRRPSIVTLVLLGSTNALAINLHIPSLPSIAKHYEASYSLAQLTLSAYLVSSGLLQVIIGPLSDRFGRRPIMIGCFAVFVIASAAAVLSPNIEFLLACRVVQAVSVAGQVVSRAVIRDTFPAQAAASRLGYITMAIAVAPMIAPVLGGTLDEFYGWRSTFIFMTGVGLLALVVTCWNLTETNSSRTDSIATQLRTYPSLLRSARFWAFILVCAFTTGGFFAFFGAAPLISTETMKLTTIEYGYYAGLVFVGYVTGNLLSGLLAQTFRPSAMIVAGCTVSVVAALTCFALFVGGHQGPLVMFGSFAVYATGSGLTLPSAIAGMMSVVPRLAGSASGLGGTIQMLASALLISITGAAVSLPEGPRHFALIMVLISVTALTGALVLRRMDRQAGQ